MIGPRLITTSMNNKDMDKDIEIFFYFFFLRRNDLGDPYAWLGLSTGPFYSQLCHLNT